MVWLGSIAPENYIYEANRERNQDRALHGFHQTDARNGFSTPILLMETLRIGNKARFRKTFICLLPHGNPEALCSPFRNPRTFFPCLLNLFACLREKKSSPNSPFFPKAKSQQPTAKNQISRTDDPAGRFLFENGAAACPGNSKSRALQQRVLSYCIFYTPNTMVVNFRFTSCSN